MSNKFRPFPPRSSRYGANMGRPSATLDTGIPLAQYAVAGPAGEYDAGGVYWGLSPSQGPVWAVWVRGKGRDGVAYVRAKGRTSAIMAAIYDSDDLKTEILPDCRARATVGDPKNPLCEAVADTIGGALEALHEKALACGAI